MDRDRHRRREQRAAAQNVARGDRGGHRDAGLPALAEDEEDRSSLARRPYVAVDCGSKPRDSSALRSSNKARADASALRAFSRLRTSALSAGSLSRITQRRANTWAS